MIRFMPDSWTEALLRPVAMAYPGGSIYVETIAPDFRFVFVVALALAWIAWRVRPESGAGRTLILLAFCAASFFPWLATSGNGRYFMPLLLVVGPLCFALIHHLPWSRRVRASVAAIFLALQGFLLVDVEPWNSWGLASWKDAPAFAIDVPRDLQDTPATYVTLTNISFSIVAPRFHPGSTWVSLASQTGRSPESADMRRMQAVLDRAGRTYVVVPSLRGETEADKRPGAEMLDAIDLGLGEHRLRVDRGSDCRLVHSRGLTNTGVLPGQEASDAPSEQRGFWLCPTARLGNIGPLQTPKVSREDLAALDRVEQLCPRMFPPGAGATTMLPIGARRFYNDTDMRLYVLTDGRVMYKYMRALNASIVGTREEVMAQSFRMDCNNIRGRAGMPWEREI